MWSAWGNRAKGESANKELLNSGPNGLNLFPFFLFGIWTFLQCAYTSQITIHTNHEQRKTYTALSGWQMLICLHGWYPGVVHHEKNKYLTDCLYCSRPWVRWLNRPNLNNLSFQFRPSFSFQSPTTTVFCHFMTSPPPIQVPHNHCITAYL